MLKCVDDRKEAFEVGANNQNDQSPQIIVHEDSMYLTWENSSPLYKDYKWMPGNPNLPLVIMPSFGHGWKVYSGMHFAKVNIKGDIISLYKAQGKDFIGDALDIDSTEAAGESQIFIVNNTLFVLYVDYHKRDYQLKLAYYKDGKFCDITLEIPMFVKRKAVTAKVEDGVLSVISDNPYEEMKIYTFDLNSYKGTIPELFKVNEWNAGEIVKTPSYKKDETQTAVFDGEELNLYWGDLHMHSNISGCSKNTRFHCTEVEEKHRFSRDVGGLDFCLLTDHDCMSEYEWAMTKQTADFNNIDNGFLSFVGLEWTCTTQAFGDSIGHYNILYKKTGNNLPVKGGFETIEKVWNELEVGQAMTIPHHTGENVHIHDWQFFNEEFQRLVEIYQVRGSYEHDGC